MRCHFNVISKSELRPHRIFENSFHTDQDTSILSEIEKGAIYSYFLVRRVYVSIAMWIRKRMKDFFFCIIIALPVKISDYHFEKKQ